MLLSRIAAEMMQLSQKARKDARLGPAWAGYTVSVGRAGDEGVGTERRASEGGGQAMLSLRTTSTAKVFAKWSMQVRIA
jgi:hypothetical protein